MTVLRWLVMVPAALATAAIAQVVGMIVLAIGHGVKDSFAFWQAADMNDWWVSGTITLLLSRGASGAFSTWAVFRIAPSHKLAATRSWLGLLVVVAAGAFIAALLLPHVPRSFSHWYRLLVDVSALLGGAFLVHMDLSKKSYVARV